MPNTPLTKIVSTSLLAFALLAPAAANAGSAALRIACDGDAVGAEVYVNGKFKGECPLDMKVPEGKLKLRVQKTVDADHEPRLFEQEIRMGDGVMKKVEVQLGPLELNAKGKRRQEEEARPFEAGMVAIPGRNYAMGKYEVTQGQWKAVMGDNPSHYAQCGDNCPVENVGWKDVQEFLQKLNAKTGKQYRLPTEAEWEYACYGGSQTEYCGDDSADAVAWYDCNSEGKTHPVGQKQANGYGLYDMSGNVWEFMGNTYGGDSISRNWPALRGGAYGDELEGNGIRVSRRFKTHPNNPRSSLGFRLARTLP